LVIVLVGCRFLLVVVSAGCRSSRLPFLLVDVYVACCFDWLLVLLAAVFVGLRL